MKHHKQCEFCSVSFITTAYQAKCCSIECRKEFRKEKQRARYKEDPERYGQYAKKDYSKNKKKRLAKVKAYYVENKEACKQKIAARWKKRLATETSVEREARLRIQKERRDTEESKEYMRAYHKKYRQTTKWKLQSRLRSRMRSAIIDNQKGGSTIADLGCSIDELKVYLESQFQPGMNWDNWAYEGWHIDHIKPLAQFDLTDPEQFKEACHYTNLQPLWAEDNIKKGIK